MSKKNVIIASVLSVLGVIILFLVGISYSSKILNPFVGIKGLIQIKTSTEKVEQITTTPTRYISKNFEEFTKYMESKGYTVEQMGRGFDLQKDSESTLFGAEGFFWSQYYIFTEY